MSTVSQNERESPANGQNLKKNLKIFVFQKDRVLLFVKSRLSFYQSTRFGTERNRSKFDRLSAFESLRSLHVQLRRIVRTSFSNSDCIADCIMQPEAPSSAARTKSSSPSVSSESIRISKCLRFTW